MTTNYGILELVGTGKLLSNQSFKLLSFIFHCEFAIMIANSVLLICVISLVEWFCCICQVPVNRLITHDSVSRNMVSCLFCFFACLVLAKS